MKYLILPVLALASGCCMLGSKHQDAAAGGPYQISKTFSVSGEGRWDYVTFDPGTQLLYVPRSSHTQIIQPATGEIVGDIPNTAGVHGVAIAPELGRGFTSNGKSNSVTIFNVKTGQVIGTTPVGERPDAIAYDPSSKAIFAFNAEGDSATVIDSAAAPGAAPRATIPLGGGPESAVADGAGHVFVNLEAEGEIVSIDTKSMKVDGTWKIDGGEEPAGLAIDPEHHHLFSGCRNKVMAVVDSQTGKTLATVPIGDGDDACAFDPLTGEAFASCNDGTVTVVKETLPGKFERTQTIHTQLGARTMTLDPNTHTLYLPTADFGEKGPGDKHPPTKPGTFRIVVVTRS